MEENRRNISLLDTIAIGLFFVGGIIILIVSIAMNDMTRIGYWCVFGILGVVVTLSTNKTIVEGLVVVVELLLIVFMGFGDNFVSGGVYLSEVKPTAGVSTPTPTVTMTPIPTVTATPTFQATGPNHDDVYIPKPGVKPIPKGLTLSELILSINWLALWPLGIVFGMVVLAIFMTHLGWLTKNMFVNMILAILAGLGVIHLVGRASINPTLENLYLWWFIGAFLSFGLGVTNWFMDLFGDRAALKAGQLTKSLLVYVLVLSIFTSCGLLFGISQTLVVWVLRHGGFVQMVTAGLGTTTGALWLLQKLPPQG